MKIVIASDSYKGTLTSRQVGEAAKEGLGRVLDAEIVVCPMADGGEGTMRALVDASGGKVVTANVSDPFGNSVEAPYGISGDGSTAVIEMAAASGIQHTTAETRDPTITSTFGTGQLISHALRQGVRSFIIGLGGSATNDAGAGMLQALGVSFTDENGEELAPGGASLSHLAHIDTSGMDPRIKQSHFRIACDVDNPLIGDDGASAIYGPQKGASREDIVLLDRALANFATVAGGQVERDIVHTPGAGAAGGMGAAFLGYFPCSLEKGAAIVADVTQLKKHMEDADIVITGEGGINHQTVFGKTPVYVAKVAKENTPPLPVIALCGSVEEGYETVFDAGIDAVFSTVAGPAELEELKRVSFQNVAQTAENVARLMGLYR
ncbi:glycerate kinase [Salimicrobium jeotgali]|uniref:Glycerate kinase n=1 Tax=Salimicrobium jeotgali TaxID=1230341 RepID=K2FQI3_9BACI|nr:glycerate kinase [Salimicrobium jeotgali]AKG04014.1 glycerate kinase [Salimicrobium jeotgali]EKE33056.1 hypothetical protein MJ3_01110 [Salimicrobium jeotgali]MBM7694949.1 glycerate kinase [Salimicrobium jeotgali]